MARPATTVNYVGDVGLERTVTLARWIGVAVLLAVGPAIPSLGLLAVLGFAAYLVLENVALRLLERRIAPARLVQLATLLDAGVMVLALVVFAPEPTWSVLPIGVLFVFVSALRLGPVGAIGALVALVPAVIAAGRLRAVALGMPVEPVEIGFLLSIYGISTLLIARVVRELHALRAMGEQHAAAVLEGTEDAIFTEDAQGTILTWNRAAERLYGYPADEVVGRSVELLVPEDRRGELQTILARLARAEPIRVFETVRARKDGSRADVELTISPILDDRGRFVGASTIARDVSPRKDFEQRILHQAWHDSLTDLPNRTLFRDRLEENIARARRDSSRLALLILDLDDFKVVNDSLGHPAGDELLRQLGARLRTTVRESDTLARLGGDEFALLLPTDDENGALLAAERLFGALRAPFHLEAQAFTLGASIGIAAFPIHGEDGDTLLRRADAAMYEAKKVDTLYSVRTAGDETVNVSGLTLLTELRQALELGQFELYYQPIVRIEDGSIARLEALLRWNHPQRGLTAPGEFIALAERSGLVVPITDWVLETAVRQTVAWQAAGSPLRVAVNVPSRSLARPDFVSGVARLLEGQRADADWLGLEITESELMAEPQRALESLTGLRALGVRVGIDDFGVAYSSFSYLQRLPVNAVKIDRSFVSGLGLSVRSAAIVRAIVELAHILDLGVIAEGVEDAQTFERLRTIGCDLAQGYFIARPMPASEVTRWIESSQSWRLRATPPAYV